MKNVKRGNAGLNKSSAAQRNTATSSVECAGKNAAAHAASTNADPRSVEETATSTAHAVPNVSESQLNPPQAQCSGSKRNVALTVSGDAGVFAREDSAATSVTATSSEFNIVNEKALHIGRLMTDSNPRYLKNPKAKSNSFTKSFELIKVISMTIVSFVCIWLIEACPAVPSAAPAEIQTTHVDETSRSLPHGSTFSMFDDAAGSRASTPRRVIKPAHADLYDKPIEEVLGNLLAGDVPSGKKYTLSGEVVKELLTLVTKSVKSRADESNETTNVGSGTSSSTHVEPPPGVPATNVAISSSSSPAYVTQRSTANAACITAHAEDPIAVCERLIWNARVIGNKMESSSAYAELTRKQALDYSIEMQRLQQTARQAHLDHKANAEELKKTQDMLSKEKEKVVPWRRDEVDKSSSWQSSNNSGWWEPSHKK